MELGNGVRVDTLTSLGHGFGGNGSVAQRLLQGGMSINSLRTNDILRKDEWKQFDDALIEVARQRLVIVTELQSRGLTYEIQNGLGKTMLEWEQISDMEAAEISMSGVTPGQRDQVDFTLVGMPLPIIHKDFNINIRRLMASRERGESLDVTQGKLASRLVMETIENMVIVGNALQVSSRTIPGVLTEGNRNTGSVTANWDLADTSGENKLSDLVAMVDDATDDNMYGPYALLVPQAAFNNLAQDFKANSDKSQTSRLLEHPSLEKIIPSKDVTAGSIALVQLTEDVLQEVIGMQPTTVQWESNGGMTVNFKVMAIMVPRVRSTVTGQSGIVHYS